MSIFRREMKYVFNYKGVEKEQFMYVEEITNSRFLNTALDDYHDIKELWHSLKSLGYKGTERRDFHTVEAILLKEEVSSEYNATALFFLPDVHAYALVHYSHFPAMYAPDGYTIETPEENSLDINFLPKV